MSTKILMFSRLAGCPGCDTMKPLAKEIPHLEMIDVEDLANYGLTRQYGIRSGLPVFVKIVDGAFDARVDGVMSKAAFTKWCAV